MPIEEFRTSAPAPATGAPRPSGGETHSPRTGLLFGLAILLIVVLGVLWFLGNEEGADRGTGPTTTEIAPGEVLTTATEGDIIPGFPEEMIAEEGVDITESYVINYQETGDSQWVLTYRSNMLWEENIAAYNMLLTSANWNITEQADPSGAPATFFYAYRENVEANITFTLDAAGVTVTIAYVAHQPSPTTN